MNGTDSPSSESKRCVQFSEAELLAAMENASDDFDSSPLAVHLLRCQVCRDRVERQLRPEWLESESRLDEFRAVIRDTDLGLEAARFEVPQHGSGYRLFETGQFIGAYEVKALLGEGGSSVVYDCYDRNLRRRVAVKVWKDHRSGTTRWKREAIVLAQLNAPGIVRVLEAFPLHDPPFIVMELLPEGTSKKLLSDGPLPSRTAAALIEGVAVSLYHAHCRGFVHRDIKPSNLLVSFEPVAPGSERREPVLKISDFGLARAFHEDSDLTPTGAVIGTPSYMSPEQTWGKPDEVGVSSDIYSLGVVLYEFIAGSVPLVSDNVVQTLRMIQEIDPLPPRVLNRDIPADLETICMKCLHKSPASRYRTALDLAEDLRRFLEGRAILARPVSRIEKFWLWCRRNPALAISQTGILLLLLTLAILATVFAVVQKDLRLSADSSAERFRLIAQEARQDSDLARTLLVWGLRNQKQAIERMEAARDDQARALIAATARSKSLEIVREYASRAKIQGAIDGRKAETLFLDAMALQDLAFDEEANAILDHLIKTGKFWPPQEPDYTRLRRVAIQSAIVRSVYLRKNGQPKDALNLLTDIRDWFRVDSRSQANDDKDIGNCRILLDILIQCHRECQSSPLPAEWLAERQWLIETFGQNPEYYDYANVSR